MENGSAAQQPRKLRVWIAPGADNPYIERLSAAVLGTTGPAEVESVEALAQLGVGDARRMEPGRDVVHLQWIEYLYRVPKAWKRAYLTSCIRAVRFVLLLAFLRIRGVRVVWTVHNRKAHDSWAPRLDALVAQLTGRLVSGIITHSEHAATALPAGWAPGRRIVIAHGHFIGVYPEVTPGGPPIRERLGIAADAPMALAFGQIRAYKRYDTLVAGFARHADPDARLVIAGKPVNAEVGRLVRDAAAKDPRIVLLDRFVTDEEVTELHAAADFGVFAYDEVFTSGTLITALSLGLPALAPDAGSATEISGETFVLRTFRQGHFAEALAEAFAPGAFGDREASRAEALRVASEWRWEDAAERLVRGSYLAEG